MTVAELGDRMSSAELSEWEAFYKIEPFGEEVHLLGHCIVASATANAVLSLSGKKFKAFTPKDFMPDWEKALEKSPQEMAVIAKYLSDVTGGEDRRK